MRIDGTHVGPNELPDGMGSLPKSAKGSQGDSVSKPQQDFQAKQNPYIPLASACEDVNGQAVAEAIDLLRQGKLDGVDFLRRAAERILQEGL